MRSAPSFLRPCRQLLLIRSDPGTIHLLDAATGQPVIVLRRNRESWTGQLAMNASGSMLCELDTRTQTIWRWDLHTLRRELRARGLDWSTAPLPPPLPDRAPDLQGLLLNLPGSQKPGASQ